MRLLRVLASALALAACAPEIVRQPTQLTPRQERYVRLKIQMGLFVGRIVPELVDKAEAEGDLAGLSFIADPLK